MQDQLNIHDAVQAALLRKIHKLHKMNCELAEMEFSGITAQELWLLESTGFVLDFDTGLVTDSWSEGMSVQWNSVRVEVPA